MNISTIYYVLVPENAPALPYSPVLQVGGNSCGISRSLGANFCPIRRTHGHTGTAVMAAGGWVLHTLEINYY